MPQDPEQSDIDSPITAEELEIIRAMRTAAVLKQAELQARQPESKQHKAERLRDEAIKREEARLKSLEEGSAPPPGSLSPTGKTKPKSDGAKKKDSSLSEEEVDEAEIEEVAAKTLRKRSSKPVLSEEELEAVRMQAERTREKARAKKRALKRLKNRLRRVFPLAVVGVFLLTGLLLFLSFGKTQPGSYKRGKGSTQKKQTGIRTSSAAGESEAFNAELMSKPVAGDSSNGDKLELSAAMKARLEEVDKEAEVVNEELPNYREEVHALMSLINKAESLEELLPLIRNPDEVGPKLKEWLDRGGKLPKFLQDQQYTYKKELNENGARIFEMLGVDAEYRPGVYYVEVLDDNTLRLDLESAIGLNKMSFAEYARRQPFGLHYFRVVGSRMTGENHQGFPESEFQGVRIFDPVKEDDFLTAYVKKDDPELEGLLSVIEADEGRYWRAMVGIRLPLGSQQGDRVVRLDELKSGSGLDFQ